MDDNDFEVEAPTPLLPQDQQASDAPPLDLEPAGPRPPARRKRLMQLGLVLAALVAVVVIFRSVIAPANSPTDGQNLTSEPTAPPATTLLTSNITFGTVTINGQRQRGTLPMFFEARNATYQITIDAPPFPSKSCTVSFNLAGPNGSGDCFTDVGNFPPMTANGITATPSYVVEMDFSGDDLPPDQQNQINALLAHSLNMQQSAAVPAGSYIATSFNADNTITSQLTSAPVQATAFLMPSPNLGTNFPASCVELICDAGTIEPGTYTNLNGQLWQIGVPAALHWHFTTSAGRVLGDASFPVGDIVAQLLAYSPTVGWSLSPLSTTLQPNGPNTIGSVDCQTGMQVLQEQIKAGSMGSSVFGGQGIEGCQIDMLTNNGAKNGSFLWRFGVLMAADDTAHHLLPNLPIASQAEISAVQG